MTYCCCGPTRIRSTIVSTWRRRSTDGSRTSSLTPRYYKLIDDFEHRLPDGPPSLREAERLVVHGDVTFGGGVVVRGAVTIDAREPWVIEPGTVLDGG